MRNPETRQLYATNEVPGLLLGRGYTGHEHLPMFGLVNMNARLYDPVLGRFLSPDPYVQNPLYSQNFNRYSYCMNNPLVFTDPDGEIVWLVPAIIGAVVGMYSGGVIANNGNFNPIKWDYSSGKTWGYMFGGAVVGGAAGFTGGVIASSGIPMANTASIVGSSLVNSIGTGLYTAGDADFHISFGFGNYNFSKGEFGYLGKKGNKWYENLGYGLGAIANLNDVLAGFNPDKVQLNTESSDFIGHSAITSVGETDPYNSLISVGPNPGGKWIYNPFKFNKGTNNWQNYVDAGDKVQKVVVKGVNVNTIAKYGKMLDGGVKYNLYLSSCVNHTARALCLSGAISVGIHPYILHAQMYLRSIGQPNLTSYFLTNY